MRRALLDDVHRIVDHLAETLGRSVMLDDPDLALLAGSRHFGDEDPYRVSVVLARGASAEAVEWFRRFDLAGAEGPVHVPGNEALGLRPRLCYPVRGNGVHLGALWLMDDGRPLDGDLVRDACVRLGRLLAERGRAVGLDEPLVDALLVHLVRGVDPDHVLDLLGAERFVDAGRRHVVAVAHPGAGGRSPLEETARRAARADHVVDHRIVASDSAELNAAVARAFPGVDPTPEKATPCMVNNTPDEQFVIGRPHGTERVVVAGGDSAHGFKHAAGVGELVAQLVVGEEPFLDAGFVDPRRFVTP